MMLFARDFCSHYGDVSWPQHRTVWSQIRDNRSSIPYRRMSGMCEVFGCGIDVEELERFDKYFDNNDYFLIDDIYTKRELNNMAGDKTVRFALSFSCKEAFFKALGVSWTNTNVSWRDVELLFSGPQFDDYTIELSAYAKEMVDKNNLRIGEVSFDYNDEFVLFQVILLTNSNNER